MRNILIFCAILLSGCQTTVPVKPSFPDAPEVLMIPCSELDTIGQESVKFSQFLKTVTGNYKKYHSCADKVAAWQEWYRQQKANQDAIQD